MKLAPSLTKKVLLLITVPVFIEMFFFIALMQQFLQLSAEYEKEARAADALVVVNSILQNTMTDVGSLAMYSVTREQKFVADVAADQETGSKDADELKRLDHGDVPEISTFLKVMHDVSVGFSSLMSEAIEQHEVNFDDTETLGDVTNMMRRIRYAGTKLIEREQEIRSHSQANQRQNRENIEMMMQVAAITNVVLAVVVAMAFALTLGKKFRAVIDNTRRIASGRQLNPALTGRDELAELDGVLHSLSYELAETRRRERAMIDNTAELICSLDENLRIAEVNDAVSKRLGYDPEQFHASLLSVFIHPDDIQTVFNRLTECKTNETSSSFDVRLKHADGGFRAIEMSAEWSKHDKRFFCVMRDVTVRKEVEQFKQQVVAMVSHDLRAPLTSVRVTLEMANSGVIGQITQNGQKYLSSAMNAVDSLMALINDLLFLERSDAVGISLDYEPTDTHSVMKKAAEMVNAEAQSKNISILTDGPLLELEADTERINRVVVNLVNNAIKFSPNNSTITLSCSSDSDENPVIRFRVADQGPGIPADKQALVFQRYRQVGTGSEGERKGSGLGLAICKSIVEAHNGQIGLDSTPGRGTTFWFVLPVLKQTAGSRQTVSLPASGGDQLPDLFEKT